MRRRYLPLPTERTARACRTPLLASPAVADALFPASEEAASRRRPLLGYAMVWTAAALFALNGTVSKVVLASGISSVELTQVRSAGAFLGFGLALALVRPRALRVRPRELAFLAAFGVAGVAFVQWFYFVAIHRLPVGIALLIQYLAPLLVALWARFVMHEHVRRRVWVALVLALAGLSLIVDVWSGGIELDEVGVAAALGAAGAYAVYVLTAERGVRRRDPFSLTCYGFLFAALFWTAVAPPWGFALGRVDDDVSLLGNLARFHAPVWLLMLFVVVAGTMVTFGLVVASLRHVPATRVGIVAMLEPVAATLVAWLWLDEALGASQLAGGAIVLVGIVLAQTAR
jgi:drug/metabolite transporter (DMT)-like permease